MNYQWRVGEKAQCILNFDAPRDPNVPVKGEVYTIENIVTADDIDECGFQLFEITNPPRWFRNNEFAEIAFGSSGFRSLTKTSIEIFEKLLVPAQKQKALT